LRCVPGSPTVAREIIDRDREAGVNKAELINRVSESVEGGRTAASRAVEAVFDAIQEAVARGEKVAITGFGVFEKVERAARTGRNPSTGEPVEVKASSVPKFRPGSEFKDYVSGAREFTRGVVTQARTAAAQGARGVADRLAPEQQADAPAEAPAKSPAKAPAKKAAAKQTSPGKVPQKAPAKKAAKKAP
jgi:DNA-binding protein HU-beta